MSLAMSWCKLLLLVRLVCFASAKRLHRQGQVIRRQALVSDAVQTNSYDVSLLVMRHGLSCSNMVQHWISKYDAGRAYILDPLLGGVGEHGSKQSGAQVSQWLQERNMTIDASLSSVLARAMETSLFAYPNLQDTLDVVPHIREQAAGDSNKPRPPAQQVAKLLKRLPNKTNGFSVNYRWAETFGFDSPGDWDAFEMFLQRSYLPELVQSLGKPVGSRIVLAITTHSLLMKNYLKDRCGSHFGRKPLNNQVLHLPYKLKQSVPDPGSSWPDKTVRYELVQSSAKCEAVAPGIPMKDEHGNERTHICLKDIGEACIGPIMKHAWNGNSLLKSSVEGRIVQKVLDISDVAEKQSDYQRKLKESTKTYKASASHPEDDHHRQASEAMSDVKLAQHGLEETAKRLATLPTELQELLDSQCWIGGSPDLQRYFQLVPTQLPRLPANVARMLNNFAPYTALPDLDFDQKSELGDLDVNISDVTVNAGVGKWCLHVSSDISADTITGRYIAGRYHESTCGSLEDDGRQVNLKCYMPDGKGKSPERGQEGVCYVPRNYWCHLPSLKSVPNHGCRPGTVCKPYKSLISRTPFSANSDKHTCQDSKERT